jgi:acetyl esterase/lipase
MPSIKGLLILFALPASFAICYEPRSSETLIDPHSYVYREIGGKKLNAYVFLPANQKATKPTSAILLFHGGGWFVGDAEWCFKDARRYAGLGMVAVAVDYRLSKGEITPMEALDDTRTAFRWVRQQAKKFNIDPLRVAGAGVSAGGHLVTAAATIAVTERDVSGATSRPNLLLLWSPALDVANDGWFKKLLQGRASASDLSPLEHAGGSTPPTCIVQGEKDTLAPLVAAKLFSERVIRSGGECELNVYQGVGHLLTRNLANQEDDYDPDPTARADGIAKQEHFLKAHGYLPVK